MDLVELVNSGVVNKASDIHITVGLPPIYRINGDLTYSGELKLNADDTFDLVKQAVNDKQLEELKEKGEIDFSFSSPGIGRFRVNAYRQRGSYGMALRIIPISIPTMESLGLPSIISDLARLTRGLILVTGPTGSGKSTTLASMIDQINKERSCHILTLEDPLEYLHKHNKSIVNQREIGSDSLSFANALRGALREDPDVILVGEMRDLETISIAITAAETGHLVLSTLHTNGAAKTIDRVIDVFPPHQQQQVKVQLSSVIQAIVSQQLLPKGDGKGRVAAHEIMIATTAIQTGGYLKMQTMDSSLVNLYKKGLIRKEVALTQAINPEEIKKNLI